MPPTFPHPTPDQLERVVARLEHVAKVNTLIVADLRRGALRGPEVTEAIRVAEAYAAACNSVLALLRLHMPTRLPRSAA